MTLALKYRPRTLDDLVGQPHITLVLGEMLRRWQADEIEMPTGLLLTGPRGCGKTSAARIIAAYLNCTELGFLPDLPERAGCAIVLSRPCGICPSCKAVHNFSSDAVMEIDGATSGLVDDMRGLGRTARLTHSGRYRVFIIDEIHAASKEAFSALLKQLEEPPPNVVYILVTTDYQAVPHTIKSRCLVFQFSALSDEAIVNRLSHIVKEEKVKHSMLAMPLIAHRAHGSMRDALMLLEQLAVLNDVTADRVQELWPNELPTFADAFIETTQLEDVERAMGVIREAFLVHHDAILMVDAVSESLKTMAIDYMNGKGKLPPRLIQKLMERTWELRISLRGASPADPILIETLWFLFAKEVGGTPVYGKATLRSVVEDTILEQKQTTGGGPVKAQPDSTTGNSATLDELFEEE